MAAVDNSNYFDFKKTELRLSAIILNAIVLIILPLALFNKLRYTKLHKYKSWNYVTKSFTISLLLCIINQITTLFNQPIKYRELENSRIPGHNKVFFYVNIVGVIVYWSALYVLVNSSLYRYTRIRLYSLVVVTTTTTTSDSSNMKQKRYHWKIICCQVSVAIACLISIVMGILDDSPFQTSTSKSFKLVYLIVASVAAGLVIIIDLVSSVLMSKTILNSPAIRNKKSFKMHKQNFSLAISCIVILDLIAITAFNFPDTELIYIATTFTMLHVLTSMHLLNLLHAASVEISTSSVYTNSTNSSSNHNHHHHHHVDNSTNDKTRVLQQKVSLGGVSIANNGFNSSSSSSSSSNSITDLEYSIDLQMSSATTNCNSNN